MKTTSKQRDEIRKGCDMYHNGMCLDSPCYCLRLWKYEQKEKRKKEKKP